MPTINDYLKYSETAFAAYAQGLKVGSGNTTRYIDVDMPLPHAQDFDASWRVLDQEDLSNGFSAVLFQEVDTQGNLVGEKVLAIRGTEGSYRGIDFLVDVINIAYFGTNVGMPQYKSLEEFYQKLIADGKLGTSEHVVVTGHSLGGFLAQAFTAEHDNIVSAAYTYNSPGFSAEPGMISNCVTQILEFFGITDATIPNQKIYNVRAVDGLSATAGLGQMIGSVQGISIEASVNPVHNHSIATLTDALVIYNLFSTIDPRISINTVSKILGAFSIDNENFLEVSLATIGEIYGQNFPRTGSNLDDYYSNVYALQNLLPGQATINSLVGLSASDVESIAKNGPAGLYAILKLNPFALTGVDYNSLNKNGCLDEKNYSDQWVEDRSDFICYRYQQDVPPREGGNISFRDLTLDV